MHLEWVSPIHLTCSRQSHRSMDNKNLRNVCLHQQRIIHIISKSFLKVLTTIYYIFESYFLGFNASEYYALWGRLNIEPCAAYIKRSKLDLSFVVVAGVCFCARDSFYGCHAGNISNVCTLIGGVQGRWISTQYSEYHTRRWY